MRSIADLVGEAPAFAALSPEHRALIAGCASNVVVEPGGYLMREGEDAVHFFLLRDGAAALETFVPRTGAVTLQTLHGGDLVGWSWLLPPYRTHFDVQVLETVHAVRFDGACLRGKFDDDPALARDLLRIMVGVLSRRLQGARMQLLDVYGDAVDR